MRKYAVYEEGFVKENGEIIDPKRRTTALGKGRATTWLKSFEASRERNSNNSREHYIQEVEIEHGEIIATDSAPLYLTTDLKAK